MSIADSPGSAPSVAVLGFSDAERSAIEHRVAKTGARLLNPGDTASTMAFADLLVIDAIDGAALDRVAARASGSRHLLVRASLQTVDAVIGLWPDADIVIGADPIDLHLALATGLERATNTPAAIFDVASEEGLRLQRLADEIGRIARSLIDLPDGLGGNGGIADRSSNYSAVISEEADPDGNMISAAEVRAIIRLRRLRDRYFPGDLFADPAWDMLLDLAAARIERTRVAVSSLCIAAAVPPTTALRWIKAMTDKDLLRRVADPHDARRIFIQLSNDAAIAMDKYLRAARGSAALAI